MTSPDGNGILFLFLISKKEKDTVNSGTNVALLTVLFASKKLKIIKLNHL